MICLDLAIVLAVKKTDGQEESVERMVREMGFENIGPIKLNRILHSLKNLGKKTDYQRGRWTLTQGGEQWLCESLAILRNILKETE